MNGAISYRKLPGTSGLFLKSRLWLGPDHLLRVRRNLFSEEYRRYYFRDIQAILLTEKESLALYLYMLAGVVAIAAGVLWYGRHPIWAGIGGVLAAFVALLGWQHKDCICALKTAVSNDLLPPLGRLRYAKRTIALIREAVEAAQGAWTGNAQAIVEGAEPPAETPALPAIPLRHYAGVVHVWLFSTMLISAALAAVEALRRSTGLSILNSVVGLVVIGLVITAGIKQRGSDLPRAIRRVVAVSIAWLALSMVGGMAIGFMLVASMDLKHPDPKAMERNPAVTITRWVTVAVYGALGTAGMALMLSHRRTLRNPPPLTIET